jgi:hypothetical protein
MCARGEEGLLREGRNPGLELRTSLHEGGVIVIGGHFGEHAKSKKEFVLKLPLERTYAQFGLVA